MSVLEIRQPGLAKRLTHPHEDLTKPVLAAAIAAIALVVGVFSVLNYSRVTGCQEGLSPVGMLVESGEYRTQHSSLSQPVHPEPAFYYQGFFSRLS